MLGNKVGEALGQCSNVPLECRMGHRLEVHLESYVVQSLEVNWVESLGTKLGTKSALILDA